MGFILKVRKCFLLSLHGITERTSATTSTTQIWAERSCVYVTKTHIDFYSPVDAKRLPGFLFRVVGQLVSLLDLGSRLCRFESGLLYKRKERYCVNYRDLV